MIASPQTSIAPAPGIHQDMPAEIYHGWNAASNSRLMDLARSPAHMLEKIQNPPAPTPALILGDAAHLNILQPEIFPLRYLVARKCSAMLKSKKDGSTCKNSGIILHEGDWFCGTHRPANAQPDSRAVLAQADYDLCRRLFDAVWKHRVARQIVERAWGKEVSAVWKCPETQVLCKLRADMLWAKGDGLCADLKTTEDASREKFMRTIQERGYAFQAAHYLTGLVSLNWMDWKKSNFVFIAVEKEPPFGVAVYRLRDDVLSVARETVLRRLKIYRRCIETNEYPCYPQEIQDIGISDWSMGQLERANQLEVL